MVLLKVRYYGDPILRKKAEMVTQFDEALRQLINDMIETMDAHNGAGIAAPQVGVSQQFFVLRSYIDLGGGRLTLSQPKVYVNPKLHSPTIEKCIDNEGCLSIPGIRGEVKRAWGISIDAQDEYGKPFTLTMQGYSARQLMHETDHLNGILYTDLMDNREKRRVEPHLKMLKRRYKKEVESLS